MQEKFIRGHGNCPGGHQFFWKTLCCKEYAQRAKHSPDSGPWYCGDSDCEQQIDVYDPAQAQLVCARCEEVIDHSFLIEVWCDVIDCPVCTSSGRVCIPAPSENWEIHLLDPNDPPAVSETRCDKCDQRFEVVVAATIGQ